MFFFLSSLLAVEASGECFSCVSNPNWRYYQDRIPGLQNTNTSTALPIAPLACTFDPMRIYADRTAVGCPGYCIKWTSATILPDGGVEVNVLRGCFDTLFDKTIHQTPQSANCYQEPSHYSHQVGVEYKSTCYCKGFMCNASGLSRRMWTLIAFLLVFPYI